MEVPNSGDADSTCISDSRPDEVAQLRRSLRNHRIALILVSAVVLGLVVCALLAHLDRIAIWNALHGAVEPFPGLTEDDVIALMGEPERVFDERTDYDVRRTFHAVDVPPGGRVLLYDEVHAALRVKVDGHGRVTGVVWAVY
jgi:hypothetical protein